MRGMGRLLFGHPLVKTLVTSLFTILGGVLVGAYVFEITKPLPGAQGQYLDWGASTHTRTFWLLVALVILMVLHGWGMERFERKVRKALSNAELREGAFSVLLPAMMESVKKEIEAGNVKTWPEVMAILGIEEDKK
jgi:hypothetical protein